MTEIPKRSTLVGQAVEFLRRDLQRGRWRDHLPSERELCEQLQVSRITVRAALETLRREGWIEVSQGQRRKIVGQPAAPSSQGSRVVGLLLPMPLHSLSALSLFLIGELQAHLHDAGYRLEVHAHERFGVRNPAAALEEITRRSDTECWIIHGGTAAIERWFAARRHRAIIVGWNGEPVLLPCLGVDYRAICRHAVGVLLSKGHLRLALVLPAMDLPGADAFEQGFRGGFGAPGSRPDAQGRVARHNGSVAGLSGTLRSLLRSPQPPTGLIVVRPKLVLTAMTYLLSTGRRVPQDVSLLSTGYEPYMDNLFPSVAHYRIHWPAFARRLFRMVLRLSTAGTLPVQPTLVMADFHDGDTLAPRR
jgi:DNA-binding LacI/PurR family transcriptional regulator